jgi:predicted RNA-binding Zn ribbon-like protein
VNIQVTVEEIQRAGFPMGGEPLVALDLVDTLITIGDGPTDLIGSDAALATWWGIESMRLPRGPMPDPPALRRLRSAIRDVLDAHLQGREARPTSVDDINAVAAAAPASLRLVRIGAGLTLETRWHTEYGGNASLAVIAREVIELISRSERIGMLRRCANPSCSMLFLAENKRRKWCTGNICGNRARVARHYERTHNQG